MSACRSRTSCSAKAAGSRSRRGGSGRGASITACARSASPRKRSRRWPSGCCRRVAFGKRIADHSVWEQRIARARIDIEMTRLLCLKAADMMDKAGNKAAQLEIAMIKVAGAEHGAADPRRCDPGAWRRRRLGRLRAGARLGGDAHAALRRRAGRGPQPRDRARRVREVRRCRRRCAAKAVRAIAATRRSEPASRCLAARRRARDDGADESRRPLRSRSSRSRSRRSRSPSPARARC